MKGSDFVATVRLSTPDDQTLAEPGDTCERVPASSLVWLAAQKLIVEAPAAAVSQKRGA